MTGRCIYALDVEWYTYFFQIKEQVKANSNWSPSHTATCSIWTTPPGMMHPKELILVIPGMVQMLNIVYTFSKWVNRQYFLSRSSLRTLAASIINSCIGMNQLNCSHMAWVTKYKCIMITTVFLFVRQIDKNKYVIINHQFRQLKLCQAMSMCHVK